MYTKRYSLMAVWLLSVVVLVAVACGGSAPAEKVVETVIVERVVPGETVVETVVVERVVPGSTVVETVVVERVVPGETVVETVVVERVVPGDTVVDKVVETVIVEKQVVATVIVPREKLVVATPTPVGQVPEAGGTIRWALSNNVSTLDVLKTTSQPEIGALHSQERLFDFDSDLVPRPTLVETWSTTTDGLTWTFKLREGITFNGPVEGRPFTSEHAMGSWRRWIQRDNFGKILNGFIESIETPDDLTFVVTLNEPTGLLLDGFARIGGYSPFMMPPEMYDVAPADAPGNGDMDTFGGTGPYQLTLWRPGDRLLFVKWSDYKSPSAPSSYLSGRKHAYADVLEAVVVPEEASRIAALETGQVDWIGPVSGDQKARLQANPALNVFVDRSGAVRIGAWPNHLKGPFSDARVRRALLMAFPKDDALLATSGDADLHRQCGSLMICETRWGGIRTPGDEVYYNPPDLEGAKRLIAEAGYTGATVTLLTRTGSAPSALVTREVAEDLGFDVDYQHVDAATYSERRADPDRFDLFFTGGPVSWGGISPLLNSTLAKDAYWNKYQDPSGNFSRMLAEFARASRERQDELIVEMQKQFYEDLQYIPFGEVLSLYAQSKKLRGVEIRLIGTHSSFVNAWKER